VDGVGTANIQEKTSMKAALTLVLALGFGLAVPASSNAAAVPPLGLGAALAAMDGVQLAQGVMVPVQRGQVPAAAPRVRGGVAPGNRGFVRPGAGNRTFVQPGAGNVGRRQGFTGGNQFARPGFVGRPQGFVGGPGYGGRPYAGRPGFYGRRAFVYGYRPWYRRPYFGTIVGGVALGTILTAAAVGVAPAYPPQDGLCWYWADPSLTAGYWDYCE
jgi:hypothetical protein